MLDSHILAPCLCFWTTLYNSHIDIFALKHIAQYTFLDVTRGWLALDDWLPVDDWLYMASLDEWLQMTTSGWLAPDDNQWMTGSRWQLLDDWL